jgi:hypothetical protein
MAPPLNTAVEQQDDDYLDYEEDEYVCDYCNGEGGDPLCDYCLPCPKCGQ